MAVWELYYEHQNITKNSTIQGLKRNFGRPDVRGRGLGNHDAIMADAAELDQMLINLALNSRKP
jgi:hypothetical protein